MGVGLFLTMVIFSGVFDILRKCHSSSLVGRRVLREPGHLESQHRDRTKGYNRLVPWPTGSFRAALDVHRKNLLQQLIPVVTERTKQFLSYTSTIASLQIGEQVCRQVNKRFSEPGTCTLQKEELRNIHYSSECVHVPTHICNRQKLVHVCILLGDVNCL